MKTLLTGWAVVKNNPVPKNLDTFGIQSIIYDVELDQANTVIGSTFYESLLLDAKDFGDLEEYHSGTNYPINVQVHYRGIVYKSLSNNNKANLPSDTQYWERVNMFTKLAYNDLWTNHLERYLSSCVLHVATSFKTKKLTNTGVTIRSDARLGSQAVGAEGDALFKAEQDRLSKLRLRNMVLWRDKDSTRTNEEYFENGVWLFDEFIPIYGCGQLPPLTTRHRFYI